MEGGEDRKGIEREMGGREKMEGWKRGKGKERVNYK